MQERQEKPMDLLNRSRNSKIVIRLKGNRTITGTLINYDIHLNMTLKDAEEITDDGVKQIGKIVLRGDNVILVSPPDIEEIRKVSETPETGEEEE